LEENLSRHRLIKRLGHLHMTHKSRHTFRRALDRLDKQSKDIMLNAEKRCRRIKSGRIPFSPEAALWIRRTQVYRSLLRYHRGLIRNRGNLKRTARRCGILQCFSLSIEDILQRIKVCIDQCDYFRKNGKQYRRKHLNKCLQTARDYEDDAKEKEILAIIQREKDRSFLAQNQLCHGESTRRVRPAGSHRKWGQRGHTLRAPHTRICAGRDLHQHPPKTLLPCRGSANLFWRSPGKLRLQLHYTDSAGYPQWNL
jgi:hypothetical protein